MTARFVPFERPRGQPLLVFAAVLGGWLVLRVLLWEAPFVGGTSGRIISEHLAARQAATHGSPVVPAKLASHRDGHEPAGLPPAFLGPSVRLISPTQRPPIRSAISAVAVMPQAPAGPSRIELSPGDTPSSSVQLAAPDVEITRSGDRSSNGISPNPALHLRRWSGDAWLFVRNDSAAPLVPGRPAYGRSQAGAVLRYRLAPFAAHRPVLYARATRALAGAREGEVAAGFAARPVPSLPVSVAGELRVHDSAAGQELRPAAFAVTELPPMELPFGLRGEAYAQAGYVGGTFATAFVDGQARVDGQVMPLAEGAEWRVGGAVSGGAQKGAGRLDVGPSAIASFPPGKGYARLAIDYRLRLAGDAEPKSGPTLTFSAGF